MTWLGLWLVIAFGTKFKKKRTNIECSKCMLLNKSITMTSLFWQLLQSINDNLLRTWWSKRDAPWSKRDAPWRKRDAPWRKRDAPPCGLYLTSHWIRGRVHNTQTLWRRLAGVIRKEHLVSTHVIAPWVRMASSIQQRMIKPMRKNTFLILENPALCNYPEQQTWPSQATTPSRSLWSGGVGQGQARRCKGGRKGQGQGGKQRASSGAQWILTLQ